ncbi:hypothetical protein EsDP_00005218 [Epichloe bromicola]|uniref:Uncharacterized protein n=1 Tax=Epichloe bromicola TaxID=79588 RepID=A0ABQ0CU09_9HYPO
MPGASPPARSGANPAARSQRHSSRAVSGAKSSMISLSIFEANRDGTADANGATRGRAPLSAEPGVYRSDGKRRVPLSAEGGVYEHDVENEPKRGTAGEGGISITNEGDKSKAKV